MCTPGKSWISAIWENFSARPCAEKYKQAISPGRCCARAGASAGPCSPLPNIGPRSGVALARRQQRPGEIACLYFSAQGLAEKFSQIAEIQLFPGVHIFTHAAGEHHAADALDI